MLEGPPTWRPYGGAFFKSTSLARKNPESLLKPFEEARRQFLLSSAAVFAIAVFNCVYDVPRLMYRCTTRMKLDHYHGASNITAQVPVDLNVLDAHMRGPCCQVLNGEFPEELASRGHSSLSTWPPHETMVVHTPAVH